MPSLQWKIKWDYQFCSMKCEPPTKHKLFFEDEIEINSTIYVLLQPKILCTFISPKFVIKHHLYRLSDGLLSRIPHFHVLLFYSPWFPRVDMSIATFVFIMMSMGLVLVLSAVLTIWFGKNWTTWTTCCCPISSVYIF